MIPSRSVKPATFFCGIAAVAFGTIASLRHYNPGHFPTVPEYAFHCNAKTPAFLEVYSGIPEMMEFTCVHNTELLLVLCAMLAGGAYLVYRSKFWTGQTARRRS